MASSTGGGGGGGGGGGVPPGFRFHPTDEELLHYYLKKKVTFQKFDMEVIREVDLNKMEPWELQEKCRIGSTPQNEWYFFSHKDRKYPTGSRTNRATNAGFWKATGRDKCIRNTFEKIGMRKTLVFYRGRAPHGHKTDWIMHEYRLEDGDDPQGNPSEDGWVICRVFKKKNLFKVGGGGGGATTGNSTAADHMLCNTNGSSSSNQSPYLMQRDSGNHQYLLLRQHANDHTQQLHLYMKPAELGLHSYSHLPLPQPHHDQYSHHHPNLFPTHSDGVNNNNEAIGLYHEFSTRQLTTDQSPLMLKQLIPRDCESAAAAAGSESLGYGPTANGLEVVSSPQQQMVVASAGAAAAASEWAMPMLDRLVPPPTHSVNDDADTNSSLHQMNQQQQPDQQLSLRGEMNFWGYAK
ncbi:hypothetical protein Ancab_036325 [Ancistrocladus abbreviatus]